jgi:hypothetical protein
MAQQNTRQGKFNGPAPFGAKKLGGVDWNLVPQQRTKVPQLTRTFYNVQIPRYSLACGLGRGKRGERYALSQRL